jgi:ABC-2 type transport system permease protein
VTGLLLAELRKLRTVRSTWAITIVGLLLVALPTSTVAFGGFQPFTGSAEQTAGLLGGLGGASAIPLIVALLAITTEFRHGTIGRTLQLTPSRTEVMGAKLVAAGTYALVFAVLGAVIALVLGLIGAATAGVSLTFTGEFVTTLWQAVAALVLTALLGVAFGALVRSQALALTVALIYIFVLESLVVFARPEVGRWLPFQALNNLFVSADAMEAGAAGGFSMAEPLAPAVAFAVFVAWVVAFSGLAIASMRYRDV